MTQVSNLYLAYTPNEEKYSRRRLMKILVHRYLHFYGDLGIFDHLRKKLIKLNVDFSAHGSITCSFFLMLDTHNFLQHISIFIYNYCLTLILISFGKNLSHRNTTRRVFTVNKVMSMMNFYPLSTQAQEPIVIADVVRCSVQFSVIKCYNLFKYYANFLCFTSSNGGFHKICSFPSNTKSLHFAWRHW